MSLAEILPKLHELDRTDKWRTVQFLIAELSQEEGIPFTHGATYPIWSPYDSYEAAATSVEPFAPVTQAFAWTQSTDVPLILGRVNFFQAFDVCFYRSEPAFEVRSKGAIR